MARCIGTAGLLLVFLCTGAPAIAGPAIFWASDPVGPDDTVLVTGAELDSVRHLRLKVLPDNSDAEVPGEDAIEIPVAEATPHSLTFVIPKEQRSGIYSYELAADDGVARGILNAPAVYWAQGDQGVAATPGGWVRVLGRNIARNESAVLLMTADDNSEVRLSAGRHSLWDAAFELPANTAPGVYRLRLWNGNGDATSWRDAGTLEVRAPATPPTLTINVKDHGAVGDGSHDDGPAIVAALESAGDQGGGTVYLPRGFYNVGFPLKIPPHVVLKGQDRDLVNIVWADFDTPPPVLLEGATDFSVEDLTLVARNHTHVISGGFAEVRSGSPGANIGLRRVRIRASIFRGEKGKKLTIDDGIARFTTALQTAVTRPDTIRLAGSNLVIEDCDVQGSVRALFLDRPRGARIARNTFRNGRRGWYNISGGDGILFEDNIIAGADQEANGGSISTAYVPAESRNILFARNRFESIWGGDREAITTDGIRGFYYGTATGAEGDGRAIVLTDIPEVSPKLPWKSAGVFIIAGRGVGQFAKVEAVDGKTVRLDRALAVPPDASSVITIVRMHEHYLLIENTFTDAGVAFQIYGTAMEHVVYGNKSTRTGGFVVSGRDYRHVQPAWYSQVLNNEIVEGNVEPNSRIEVLGTETDKTKAPLNFGTVLRGNTLAGNSRILLRGFSRETPRVSDVLIEHNTVRNSDVGISIDEGVRNVFLRDNSFSGVDREIVRAPGAVDQPLPLP